MTGENTETFYMWKYHFYLFRIYSDFTAYNKIKRFIPRRSNSPNVFTLYIGTP